MSGWVLVRATFDANGEDRSPVIGVLMDHGAQSVLEEGPDLVAYYPRVDGVESVVDGLRQALMPFAPRAFSTEFAEDQDWQELFRAHFRPRRVGRRIIVRPTWEPCELEPDDIELILDPGQAFGSGDHPTTRLCLELLEESIAPGRSVLDVGCGSGILAIAAAKLGANPVTATDIDPLSVEVARENAERNGVVLALQTVDGLPDGDQVDVVLANIISAVLIRLAPAAALTVRPGGAWIVSGIIRDNWPDVRAAAERVGFTLETHREELDWVGARFRR